MSFDELSDCVADNSKVEENFERKELADIISRFLKEKDEKKRVIFIQRYFYMADFTDIANKMGMKESSVRSTLSRMRKELKNYLEQEDIVL